MIFEDFIGVCRSEKKKKEREREQKYVVHLNIKSATQRSVSYAVF